MSWTYILILILIILTIVLIGILLYFLIKKYNISKVVSSPRIGGKIVQSNIQYSPAQEEIPRKGYKVIGARDGSWFQVLDRRGDIIASFSTPNQDNTFEAECYDGNVELVGITSTSEGNILGPVGCSSTTTDGQKVINYIENNSQPISIPNNQIQQVYTLSDSPAGYQKIGYNDGVTGMMNGVYEPAKIGRGISYISVRDIPCSSNNDCPEGTICSGGYCAPIQHQ